VRNEWYDDDDLIRKLARKLYRGDICMYGMALDGDHLIDCMETNIIDSHFTVTRIRAFACKFHVKQA
jgi:hypothetical protein